MSEVDEVSAFSAGKKPLRWTCARLWLRIHADAFRLDPWAYLQAVVWRIRRLRVRSRNRMSALTGRSPAAYAFWVSCKEPAIRAGLDGRADASLILPVIDCTGGSEGLDRTLASLSQNVAPLIVGEASTGGLQKSPDLTSQFAGDDLWICPIACGDRLAAGALAIYAAAIAAAPENVLIYADDDLIDGEGTRREPHFKPQWNPELFQHHDFLTGASVVKVRRSDVEELEAGARPEGLIRKALERGPPPHHLPYVLHHRASRPAPSVPPKPAVLMPGNTPTITVIIPTRNRLELLETCVKGVRETGYPDIQLIVVDNESDDPRALAFLEELQASGATVLRMPGAFNFSALNNAAARQAGTELLCFLNNDVEVIEPDWLALLARHAVRPEIGAVGARLLYADGTVQHAGVFTGIGGGAGHAHRFLGQNEPGYFERARLPQLVSAVTAACLVVNREKFLAVGGFDEKAFPVAFNDVDLCLKLNARGWQSFYEPRATLIHHESKSRGSDSARANRARFAGELAALKRKWGTDAHHDPFHHPQLSPFCEQFLIAV